MPSSISARPSAPAFSSFGWSIAGIIAVALSMPPVGFYPLAWIGLVPILVRWATRPLDLAYVRELYALFLVAACTIGFWLLIHHDAKTALAGGVGLFLLPLPWVVAFSASAWVRRQFGLEAGLAFLLAGLVAMEYVVLHARGGMPWMVLGHSQATALPFLRIAALGGVPLLTLWVGILNVLAFLALPRPGQTNAARSGGVFVASLAVMIALPPLYGQAMPSRTDSASGYSTVHVIQPGLSGSAWEQSSTVERVDYLAELSAHSLRADAGRRHGTVVWPATSIRNLGGEASSALVAKLRTWARRSGVTVVSGATVRGQSSSSNAALLVEPGRPTLQYSQMRVVPVVDRAVVDGDAIRKGTQQLLFPTNGVQLAPVLGFEWMFGDHVRRGVAAGADALVVFPHIDRWGNSPGLSQALSLLRLRAVETNRAIVVSAVSGGSALIRPSGEIEELGPWMDQALVTLQVPIHRDLTPYAMHGDWLGVVALFAFGILGVLAVVLDRLFPGRFRTDGARRKRRAARETSSVDRPAFRRGVPA